MKKISTLYKKDPSNLALVIDEVDPNNAWVFTDAGVKATRKWDGTACAIIGHMYYKRYDVKKGRAVPDGAIPCQDPDPITGHWPHWVKVDPSDPVNKYHVEGIANTVHYYGNPLPGGTYELVGPKVQGNPHSFERHRLIQHGADEFHVFELSTCSFNIFKMFLSAIEAEGIVFHHPDGRMCKLRKSDFGIKW